MQSGDGHLVDVGGRALNDRIDRLAKAAFPLDLVSHPGSGGGVRKG